VLKKIVPFHQDIYAGYGFTPANFAVRNFIQTIGESIVFWDTKSAACYFEAPEGMTCDYNFPSRIFNSNLTFENIEEARTIYLNYKKNPSDSLAQLTISKFNLLSDNYKKDHAFAYYILNPMMLCKNFLIHSGSYYLPIKKDSACYHSYQWALKLFQSLLYYLSLVFGFLGIFLLSRKFKNSFIIISIPIYLIIMFPIYFKMTEYRYFSTAYPFLLIGVVCIFYLIKQKWDKYRVKVK